MLGEAGYQGAGISLLGLSDAEPVKRRRGRPKSALRNLLGLPTLQVGQSNPSGLPSGVVQQQVDHQETQVVSALKVRRFFDLQQPLLSAPSCGRMKPDGVLDFVQVMQQAALAEPHVLDEPMLGLAKFFLEPATYSVISSLALSKQMDLNPGSINLRRCRLACFMFLQQVLQRRMLERAITVVVGKPSLLLYVDFSAYDETPMKLCLKDPVIVSDGSVVLPVSEVGMVSFTSDAHLVVGQRGQAVITKILQTQSTGGCLFSTVRGLQGVMIKQYTPLQSLAQTTGEVMYQALASASLVSESAESYPMKLRSVVCDKAGGNKRGELFMLAHRPGWLTWLWSCDIHALATCHKKVFSDLMKPFITGMVQCSLALRSPNSWQTFRSCVAAEVGSRPLQVVTSIPQDATSHKECLLGLLYGGSGKAMKDAVTLLASCSGDWRQYAIQVAWTSEKEPPSTAELRNQVIHGLFDTILASKPALWPNSRWTGFREAARDLFMLHYVHDLFYGSWCRYVEKMKGVTNTKASQTVARHATGVVENAMDAEFDPLNVQDALPQQSEGILAFGDGHNAEMSFQHTSNMAEVNATDRAIASTWLEGKPQASMTVLLIVLSSLDKIFLKHFHLASEQWELEQRSSVAKSLLSGEVPKRLYRLSIAATLELESQFFMDLHNCFCSERLWNIMVEEGLNLKTRALSFQMLARLGGVVKVHLSWPHTRFPMRTFKVLSDVRFAQEIACAPDCIKDGVTRELEAKYGSVACEEALAMLTMVATAQAVDTSVVEAKHASIRRQVVLRSCQSWSAALLQVSAEWIIQNFRRASNGYVAKKMASKKVLQLQSRWSFKPM
eukprot:6491798-Amphidinium_carterae.1